MLAKLYSKNIEPLLDIEKHGYIYLLKDVKKLDYGYSAKLRWLKKDFPVLVIIKKDCVEIVEENGKFCITVVFKTNEAEVNLYCPSLLKAIFEPLTWRIVKNIEKYSTYAATIKANSVLRNILPTIFDLKPSKILDLRGESCPVPEIESKKAILNSNPYELIEVLVDHPAAVLYTLPEVARVFGCKYFVKNMGDYASFIFICGRREGEVKIDLSNVKNLMRDERLIANLYLYFDKVEKRIKVESISQNIFNCDGTCLIVASPEGRGWLLTALVENGKVISARLSYGNVKLYDTDAINMVINSNGIINVYYLRH